MANRTDRAVADVASLDDARAAEGVLLDEPRFRVTVEARRLARATFDRDAALREALAAAPIIERSWELTA